MGRAIITVSEDIMPANPVPRGLRTVTASHTVKGAKQAIEFYKNAFCA